MSALILLLFIKLVGNRCFPSYLRRPTFKLDLNNMFDVKSDGQLMITRNKNLIKGYVFVAHLLFQQFPEPVVESSSWIPTVSGQ